jgi:hypothetical protein
MVSVIFCVAVNVFNMGPPEDIHWRPCLTWAYKCKKLSTRFVPVSGPLGTIFLTSSDSWFHKEDDGVGHFLLAVTVFNMGPPEDIHWRLCLTWAYM